MEKGSKEPTPGPWVIKGNVVCAYNAHGTIRFQASVHPGFVGEFKPHDDIISYEELRADIRLIAASCKLLEAAVTAHRAFGVCSRPIGPEPLDGDVREQWEEQVKAYEMLVAAIKESQGWLTGS